MRLELGSLVSDGSSSDKVITAAHEHAYKMTECTAGKEHSGYVLGFYAGVDFVVEFLVKEMFKIQGPGQEI